ncbi:MAG: hypothetical protein ND866_22410, partial [Pyrinomonadaceae bacterium]|nr:hypothetical protein [Pyrinomonadaceae bacterium]
PALLLPSRYFGAFLPKDLIRDGSREHVAGDVSGRSGKGQYGNDTVASHAISDEEGARKRFWTTGNESQ